MATKMGPFYAGFHHYVHVPETIQRTVVQKINERLLSSGQQLTKPLETLDDVYNLIGERISKNEVNEVINSMRICDPAVGSAIFWFRR